MTADHCHECEQHCHECRENAQIDQASSTAVDVLQFDAERDERLGGLQDLALTFLRDYFAARHSTLTSQRMPKL
jgi:hypothetical protein